MPKADPPVLQIFGNVQQATPLINLPPAAAAKSGFSEHSAAALGTESKFPPAKAAAENLAARQLSIPKPTGPNKAAKNSTPTILEVSEKKETDAAGRMAEAFKRRREDFEDEEDLFGFEYIPANVSPPWFPNQFWGIPATVQQHLTDWSDWSDKNWYASYNNDNMDPAIPYPVHAQGIKTWACTKIKLKKYKNKDISYHEFLVKIFNHDAEEGQFSMWVLAHYGPKILVIPKIQAPDLTAFLKKMRADAFLVATTIYRRELIIVAIDKKSWFV